MPVLAAEPSGKLSAAPSPGPDAAPLRPPNPQVSAADTRARRGAAATAPRSAFSLRRPRRASASLPRSLQRLAIIMSPAGRGRPAAPAGPRPRSPLRLPRESAEPPVSPPHLPANQSTYPPAGIPFSRPVHSLAPSSGPAAPSMLFGPDSGSGSSSVPATPTRPADIAETAWAHQAPMVPVPTQLSVSDYTDVSQFAPTDIAETAWARQAPWCASEGGRRRGQQQPPRRHGARPRSDEHITNQHPYFDHSRNLRA